jgi:hypothetical protein
MILEIILLYHGYLQKSLKRLLQKSCKNNPSSANVVQNLKLKGSNHIYLEIL